MANIIIYHQAKENIDCPDGIASAWIAHRKYPDAQVWGWCYQTEPPKVENGDRLIIVDFSFPKDIMQSWADSGVEVVVIDHHETAMNNLAGLSDRILAKFDMAECGATLTWKTLFPDELMPYFLNHVRDHDLWDFLLPETQAVHEAMSTLLYGLKSQPKDVLFSLFDGLAALDKESLHKFLLPIGNPLIEPKRQKVEAIANRFEWGWIDSPVQYRIPFVKLAKDGSEDRYVSDVCMKLYRDMPDASFVACITSDGSVSLRSDKHGNNTDVGAIASQFGGGGHRNASGFKPS